MKRLDVFAAIKIPKPCNNENINNIQSIRIWFRAFWCKRLASKATAAPNSVVQASTAPFQMTYRGI